MKSTLYLVSLCAFLCLDLNAMEQRSAHQQKWLNESLAGSLYHRDYTRAQKFIDDGADVNFEEGPMLSLLAKAAYKNDEQAVKLLIDSGKLQLSENDKKVIHILFQKKKISESVADLLKKHFPSLSEVQVKPLRPRTITEIVDDGNVAEVENYLNIHISLPKDELINLVKRALDKENEARKLGAQNQTTADNYHAIALLLLSKVPFDKTSFEDFIGTVDLAFNKIEILNILKAHNVRWGNKPYHTLDISREMINKGQSALERLIHVSIDRNDLSILDYALQAGAHLRDFSGIGVSYRLENLGTDLSAFIDGLLERGLDISYFERFNVSKQRIMDYLADKLPYMRNYFESRGYTIEPITHYCGLVKFKMKD